MSNYFDDLCTINYKVTKCLLRQGHDGLCRQDPNDHKGQIAEMRKAERRADIRDGL